MYKLFFLILFSVSSLLALPPSYANSRIAIGSNPAYITHVDNARNVTPDVVILLVEEELTKSNCSKDSDRSYILVDTENPEEMKKYKETIEKDNNNDMIDPDSRITPHFIAATHLLKGSAAFDRGCAMVNLRIEDRKGCIIAQEKISVTGIRDPGELIIDKLIPEAASSLRYQICNSKSNEQTCSKSHYTDELFCPYYFTITTTTNYKSHTRKDRPRGAAIRGPMVLTSSSTSSHKSKQVMYVDPKNGIVELVGLEKDAKSRYESQADKFDKKQCAFVNKIAPTRVNEGLQPSLARVVRHNIFKANSNAFIDLKVTNNNFTKRFRIPWRTLQGSGSWSGSGSKSTFDEPSAEDKAMENKIKNSEVYNKIVGTGRKMANSGFLGDWNAKGKKGASTLGMNKQQLCTFQSVELLFGQFTDVDLSFNAKINVRISPSSKSDIKEFSLYSNAGKGHKVRGREIVLPRYEEDAEGIFGHLQNSLYNHMSQKDKDAWNKSDKESKEEIKNKKDAEEFDSLSIDDLKMFSQ